MKISRLTLNTIATFVAACIFVSGCVSYRYTFETEPLNGNTGDDIPYTVVPWLNGSQYSPDALPVVVDSQKIERVRDIEGGKKVINGLGMFLTIASLGIIPSVYEDVGTENVREEYVISIESPIGSKTTNGYVYQREWWGLICIFGFGDINKADLSSTYYKNQQLRESKMQEEMFKMRDAAVRDLVCGFSKEDFKSYTECIKKRNAKISEIRQMIAAGEIEAAIKECKDAKSNSWGVAVVDNGQWEDLIVEACERTKMLVPDIDDASRLANLYSLLDSSAYDQSIDEEIEGIFLRLCELNKVDTLPYETIESMAKYAQRKDVKLAAIQNLKDVDKAKVIVWIAENGLLRDAVEAAICSLAHVEDEKVSIEILTIAIEADYKGNAPVALAEVPIPDNVVSDVICNMAVPWQKLIDKVTQECAYNILIGRGQKVKSDAAFEKALVDRLAESKVDENLYNIVSSRIAKEAIVPRLPADAKAFIKERERLEKERERLRQEEERKKQEEERKRLEEERKKQEEARAAQKRQAILSSILPGKEFLGIVREANFRSNTGNEIRDNRIREEHLGRVMGKVITVKGTVKSIEVTMFTDYPKLILNVYGKSVSARMDGMSKDEAAELDPGMVVVVRGIICDRPVISDLAMENCQLCLIEQSSAVRQNEAALNGAANIVMDSDNVLSGKEFLAVVREANFRSNTGNELRDNRIRDEHRSRVMGKVITVKGTVKSIEVTMFTDYPKLILNVYGKSVSARMDGMSKDEAAELDAGMEVIVRGTVCDRLVTSDLALENCVIVK